MKLGYIGIVILFIVAYLVGVKFPSIGQSALAKVGM